MTKFQIWLANLIINKIIWQGGHKERIVQFYGLLVAAARKQFNEDTMPSLDSFLQECHQEALDNNGIIVTTTYEHKNDGTKVYLSNS